jgi:hypothetical protein
MADNPRRLIASEKPFDLSRVASRADGQEDVIVVVLSYFSESHASLAYSKTYIETQRRNRQLSICPFRKGRDSFHGIQV